MEIRTSKNNLNIFHVVGNSYIYISKEPTKAKKKVDLDEYRYDNRSR